MQEWVPLFQTLVWPVFIVVFLIIYRKRAAELLRTIEERIRRGANFSVGPISIGSAPSLEPEQAHLAVRELDSLDSRELQRSLYLIHTAKFAKVLPDGKNDYSITVQLDSAYPDLFAKVTKVAYHLHPSYAPRDVRESSSPQDCFELKFYAWGTFNLFAEIFIEGRERPVIVWRYINF